MSADKFWDAFVSHASEDKDGFVRPLAEALRSWGAKVWYDEFSLKIGDSLSQSIDNGLARSRFGVVILSQAFMAKAWPLHELRGLTAMEVGGQSRILPVWHQVSFDDVLAFSPPLADKLAVSTTQTSAVDVALKILQVIRPDLYTAMPRDTLIHRVSPEAVAEMEAELARVREALSEYRCRHCGSRQSSCVPAPVDDEEKHWDERCEFECGFRTFGGQVERLCPADSNYPRLTDYELAFHHFEMANATFWNCSALPRTDAARKVPLPDVYDRDKELAAKRMASQLEEQAARRR